MQMNMTTPAEIGMEQVGPYGEDAMFALKTVDKSGELGKVVNGTMHTVTQKPEEEESDAEEVDSDDHGDDLEGQLDSLYEQYQERKSEVDAKYRAKKARKEHTDDFEGFSDREDGDVSSEDEIVEDEASDDSSDDEDQENIKPLFHNPGYDVDAEGGLSRRAAMFFDQDIFKGISGLDMPVHDDSGIDMEDGSEEDKRVGSDEEKVADESAKPSITTNKMPKPLPKVTRKPHLPEDASDSDTNFEVVKRASTSDWNDDPSLEPTKDGRPDIDIITAEAMTLAHALATGAQTRQSLADDSFNKYSLRDVDGLPAWFLDDESTHSRLQRPITAAGAAAIKEKMRALNARPIKKVREAKARKKFKANQRLEKLKKKSGMVLEDEGMSEGDKARTSGRLMNRARGKRGKEKVTLVVARGGNRGISGRPRGTKGKYKMVDARMKKEKRAEKRLAKKRK